MVYIAIAGLALMNMVTASVLESATRRTKDSDKEVTISNEMSEIEEILKLTNPLTGSIDREKFSEQFEDCWPLQDIAQIMMLETEDRGSLFELMGSQTQ